MPVMHAYRCYVLDASNDIASVALIRCPDDDAAKLRAHDVLAIQSSVGSKCGSVLAK